MEIERTTFGTITIDGKTYEHDVIIRLSGEVARRKKKLSKKYYGTSHVLSKDEAKFVFENGCEQLILGSGQMGNVHLSPEAEAYFAKKRAARSCCSRPPRQFVRSTARMRRRSAFFTLPAESGRPRLRFGGMSQMCHSRNHAPQQQRLYSITSSERAMRDGGTSWS